jgi:hypothetical protein
MSSQFIQGSDLALILIGRNSQSVLTLRKNTNVMEKTVGDIHFKHIPKIPQNDNDTMKLDQSLHAIKPWSQRLAPMR